MYFPYIRGRQYDLLALKELIQRGKLNKKIFPVIEPVKASSTLYATLRMIRDNAVGAALIINPQVGYMIDGNVSEILEQCSGTLIPAFVMEAELENKIEALDFHELTKIFVIDNADNVEFYNNQMDSKVLYSLMPDSRIFRRIRANSRILLGDHFNKKHSNAEYLKEEDEFFSDDIGYYEEEGYVGFSDYSIIGHEYDESGFLPRAVAIHIIYFDENGSLRIHHFVSDSNYGTEDVAGKYFEAVTKLRDWVLNGHERQMTYALEKFMEHAETGYFPGLPTIKKLSIMHHIELVEGYMNGNM